MNKRTRLSIVIECVLLITWIVIAVSFGRWMGGIS